MSGTVFYPLTPPGGGHVDAESGDLAGYLADGYVPSGPAYVVPPDGWEEDDGMPRKLIAHSDGRRFSVTHAAFTTLYEPLGFTEVADEPDPVVATAPATYPAVDDAGAWDDPPFFVVTHADGRRLAMTEENYANRYHALGFTLAAEETPAADSAALVATLAPFYPPGNDAALYREGLSYLMCQALGQGRYAAYELIKRAVGYAPGGAANLTLLGDDQIRAAASGYHHASPTISPAYASDDVPWVAIAYHHTDAAISPVYSTPASWSTTADAAFFGGSYRVTLVAGLTATWTTPAAATRVGMLYQQISNGGMIKVSIDGDATRANLLPTAQDLVANGTLASTALVANGGTLNPTDRILDMYTGGSAVKNAQSLFANDLASTTHTVVLLNTGYKRAAASSARLYVVALLAGTSATLPSDTNAFTGTQVLGIWTSLVDAAIFGGSTRYTLVAGVTATWTTPGAITRVGMLYYFTTNGGVLKVSIDGDATRANLLPTAQDLVTLGTLASSALVANGGTLNPTDRVLDQYSLGQPTNKNKVILFADDLTSGAHTVVLTCTGYKHPGSSATRMYANGLLAGSAASTLADANAFLALLASFSGLTGSAKEHALTFVPTVGQVSPVDFIGTIHGYEYEDTVAYRVDGATVTPADGQIIAGSQIGATVTTHLRHPDLGATNVATIVATYTLWPRAGLRLQQAISWLRAGEARRSYVAMYPLGTTFNRGSTAGDTADYDLDPDSGLFVTHGARRAAYLWQASGLYAAMLFVPNPATTVNNWTYASPTIAGLAIEDRAAGTTNKAYLTRATEFTPEPIAPGDVWRSDVYYRIQRFPGGANAALARS